MSEIAGLEHKLLRVAGRKKSTDLLWLLLRTCGILVCLFFVYFLSDWTTDFPAPVRVILTIALPVGLYYFGVQRWKSKVFSETTVIGGARLLERMQIRFNSHLISSVQFAENIEAPGGSPLLREHTIRVTEDSFDEYAQVKLEPPEAWGRTSVWLLSGVLLFGGMGAASPDAVVAFFQRIFGLQVAYPTKTRLVELKYPQLVANDQSAILEIKTEGKEEDSGTLRLTFEGQSSADLSIKSMGPHQWRYVVNKPPVSFTVEVLIGDAMPQTAKIKVSAPPGVKQIHLKAVAPDYAKIKPVEADRGTLAFLEGSMLSIEMVPNRELKSCKLRLPDQIVELKAEKEKTEKDTTVSKFKYTFMPKTSFSYSFDMEDMEGLKNSFPVEYQIELKPDRAPDVLVTAPELERPVSQVSLFPLQFKATDDLCLKQIDIEYYTESIQELDNNAAALTGQVDEKNIQRKKIPLLTGLTEATKDFSENVPVVKFETTAGNLIHWRLAVRDTCPLRDQVAYSDERVLRVLTPQELARLLEERREALMKTFNKILDDETGSQKRLRKILDGEK